MVKNFVNCQYCSLASICLPVGLNLAEMENLADSISKQNTYERNYYLGRRGNQFNQLYAVKSGAFKATTWDTAGNQRIYAFYLPGEIIGLDCIADKTLHYDIIALETSSACEVSSEKLFEIAAKSMNLQTHLFNLMSKRLANNQRFNSNADANERLAMFLFEISSRYKNCGLSASSFNLPMSRDDIGDFLGLATETVSRTLTKFQDNTLIKVSHRTIQILNLNKLASIANYN